MNPENVARVKNCNLEDRISIGEYALLNICARDR